MVKEIKIEHIKKFIEYNYAKKLSTKTIKNAVTLLGKMFNYFLEKRYIDESPYNGILNLKNDRPKTIRILNEQEIECILQLAENINPDLFYMIKIILSTGMKKAEILALKCIDINFQNKKIFINHTLYEGKLLIPTSRTVIREINMPINLIADFKKLVKGKKHEDFLFTNKRLNLNTNDNRVRQHFSQIMNQIELNEFKFNDLRHTYAYMALQNGISIDHLHKRLGDYSIQATMDKYRDFIQ